MTNPTIRWQHHKMDHMQPMLPVGTTSTSPAVQCEPTGPQYVLASDYDAEIEQLRAALKIAQQSLLEFSHAQECGPSWYTRGENGMYQQVRLWLRRGLEAVQGALGPYDDNGQYLKERPAAESSAPQSEQLPINRALVHALGFCVIPLPQGSVTVENRSPDPVVVTVDRATVKPHTGYSG